MDFFKCYNPESSSLRMQIPPAYIRQMEGNLQVNITLRDRYGNKWPVGIDSIGNDYYFHDGWGNFVEDNSLIIGDFLVLSYDGNDVLDVKLLGRTHCDQEGVRASKSKIRAEEAENKMAGQVEEEKQQTDYDTDTTKYYMDNGYIKKEKAEYQEAISTKDDSTAGSRHGNSNEEEERTICQEAYSMQAVNSTEGYANNTIEYYIEEEGKTAYQEAILADVSNAGGDRDGNSTKEEEDQTECLEAHPMQEADSTEDTDTDTTEYYMNDRYIEDEKKEYWKPTSRKESDTTDDSWDATSSGEEAEKTDCQEAYFMQAEDRTEEYDTNATEYCMDEDYNDKEEKKEYQEAISTKKDTADVSRDGNSTGEEEKEKTVCDEAYVMEEDDNDTTNQSTEYIGDDQDNKEEDKKKNAVGLQAST